MPEPPPEPIQLPELHLEILKLLWSEWDEARSGTVVIGGLTRDEIFQRLKGRARTKWKPPQGPTEQSGRGTNGGEKRPPPLVNKSETLKGHLQALCDRLPKRVCASRTADYRGAPFVYMINDLTTVTYSSTAFMLLEIFRRKHIEQRDLAGAMHGQRKMVFLLGNPTLEEVTAEIKQQINWCRTNSYVKYVDEHATELRPTSRLLYEYRFLEFVAAHPRAA